MTTMTHPHGIRLTLPKVSRTPALSARADQSVSTRAERWFDQLAAWAERQPRHHHLGRWISLR